MEHYDSILNHLREGDKAEVIHLDYAKAFDKVDFGIVLKKAERLGNKGNILNFLRAFLMDRAQSVVVISILSEPSPVLSGITPGSIRGPLLLSTLVGDSDENIKFSVVSSFADDTRSLMCALGRI